MKKEQPNWSCAGQDQQRPLSAKVILDHWKRLPVTDLARLKRDLDHVIDANSGNTGATADGSWASLQVPQ